MKGEGWDGMEWVQGCDMVRSEGRECRDDCEGGEGGEDVKDMKE